MKDMFDVGEFLRGNGMIYTRDQGEWLNAFQILREFGFEAGFPVHEFHADDYPYIYLHEIGSGNLSARAIRHAKDVVLTYEEFISHINCQLEIGESATQEDIFSLLYE